MNETKRRRRPRRSREEVLDLIRTSALRLFAERGFAGTTTLEIARHADVSETLLFRHFGDKASLYDAVVSAPFLKIIEAFKEHRRRQPRHDADEQDPYHQSVELYDFFDQNREIFSALVLGSASLEDGKQVRLTGLEDAFRQAAEEVHDAYAKASEAPPFNADVAARLAFGTVAASVLLRPLLFSGSDASSDEIRETLKIMSARSLWPK